MGMHGNRSGVAVTSQWAPKELRAPMTAEEKKEREKMEKAKANDKIAQAVIQLSRLKYGRPVELVDAEVSQRARL